jgi:beta-galactosidase/beta-glucuronidase
VITITFKGQPVGTFKTEGTKKACGRFAIPDDIFHLWSPEEPNLYDVLVTCVQDGKTIDSVCSYFGMRKFSIQGDRFHLNNAPYTLRLILDQGYHPDSLLAWPDDDMMTEDILISKKMGFNGARKHEKIEPGHFMHEADRLGFLVSLEMPSAYSFHPSEAFVREWTRAMARDHNHPSLFMYVPFNESWGVRNIARDSRAKDYVTGFYHLTKSLDPTRPVSTNDGWEQTLTDICAIHTYRHGDIGDSSAHARFRSSFMDKNALLSSVHTDGSKALYVDGYQYRGEPVLLSEFGGISYVTDGSEGWGYTGVRSAEDFERELRRLFRTVHDSPHLSGFCYTQLTDVMQEVNGLLTADRTPKLPLDVIRSIVTDDKS